jgi:hypothetical protein
MRLLNASIDRVGISVATVVLLGLSACAGEPPRSHAVRLAARPDTNVYFYPAAHGPLRSADQQNRDRFECNDGAVRQSDFDPGLPDRARSAPVQVFAREPPVGTGVAAGAVSGAVVGAAVSRPWNAGSGMLIGALAGAAIGGVADVARENQAEQFRVRANADATAAAAATLDREAADYRRAMAACLRGRGYIVQ